MVKTITITRKIEFYPIGDNRNDFYSFVKSHARLQTQAKQHAYNKSIENNILINSIANIDSVYNNDIQLINDAIEKGYEDIKNLSKDNKNYDKKLDKLKKDINKGVEKRNKLLSQRSIEARKTLESALGYKESKMISNLSLMSHGDNNSPIIEDADQKTYLHTGTYIGMNDFKNDLKDGLLQGRRAPRVYNTFDILDVLINTSVKQVRNIRKEDSGYYFDMHNYQLKVNLGSKPSRAGVITETLNGVISGAYKTCDSKIQMKNNKLFLLLVLQQEVEQPVLDKEKAMGIDLGMDIPAYVAMEFKPEWGRAFGNKKELLSFKTKIKKMKDLEKQRGIYARGGHGRKRKLKNNKLEALRNRESNFSKTYNHTLSKQIVDYAIKNKVGTIRMEKLDGKSFKNQKMLGDWTYYMLQQMIQTKGEAKGINIEFVNPAYTSSVCSTCGHHKTEFKLGNRDGEDGRQFHCDSCGLKINSDHNAAINISKGGIRSDIIRKIQEAK